mmetsp:Transcript_3591/g.6294  ORF Transcript_3591/g.6294 Transcript_3591/m.6294 type:complete len:117 (+) Transcript_3591:1253-1603(+)
MRQVGVSTELSTEWSIDTGVDDVIQSSLRRRLQFVVCLVFCFVLISITSLLYESGSGLEIVLKIISVWVIFSLVVLLAFDLLRWIQNLPDSDQIQVQLQIPHQEWMILKSAAQHES